MSDFLTEEAQLLQGSCPELEAGYQFTKKQIAELEGLRLKVAKQAAVIEEMIASLNEAIDGMGGSYALWSVRVKAVLALKHDSKQILAEWLDKQLGEPVTTIMLLDDAGSQINMTLQTPLFKKPGVLK